MQETNDNYGKTGATWTDTVPNEVCVSIWKDSDHNTAAHTLNYQPWEAVRFAVDILSQADAALKGDSGMSHDFHDKPENGLAADLDELRGTLSAYDDKVRRDADKLAKRLAEKRGLVWGCMPPSLQDDYRHFAKAFEEIQSEDA